MRTAARAARPAFFQYPLRAPTDVGGRRGGPGAEHQRNRATPRNSAHDLRRRRRSIRAGHCAAVDRAAGIRRSARVPAFREGDYRTRYSFKTKRFIPSTSRRGRCSGAPGAPGRAGIPLAHLHAPGHLRWLVARRARRGARSLHTTPSLPERHRPWRRSRFSTRTLRTGSGTGGHIRRSLRSSHTGESSFAIRCP